jgi:hypothetical protein
MSELDLADFPKEDASPFEEPEKETPSDSPAEDKPTDDTVTEPADTQPSEGETPSTEETQNTPDEPKKPFHEDPAIQEYLQRQLDVRDSKNREEIRKEIEQSLLSKFPPQETNIPSWFGGDEQQWRAYQADQQRLVDTAKAEALLEIENRSKAEQERVAQANSYIDSQLAALQSEGKKFDRNELLKIVTDFRPVNESGNWDFRKAYEIYELKQAKDPEKSKARKALASTTTSNPKAETTTPNVLTYDEIKKKGWHSF